LSPLLRLYDAKIGPQYGCGKDSQAQVCSNCWSKKIRRTASSVGLKVQAVKAGKVARMRRKLSDVEKLRQAAGRLGLICWVQEWYSILFHPTMATPIA
jgi:hypothetical protein